MIGEIIKRFREERGWTQEELANRMGYTSKSTINKIEKNINDVNQSKIEKFAEVFNCDPTELVVTKNIGIDKQGTAILIRSAQETEEHKKAMELYELYQNLTPENRIAFETLLKNLQSRS